MFGELISGHAIQNASQDSKPQDRQVVNIAVLGCGYWGINYVRVFNELPNTRITAVCDQRPERLAEVCRRFHDVDVTFDISDVLQRKDVDAIVVCTPATTHYEFAFSGLKQGKHILIEKPITTTAGEAENLLNSAESQRLVLMVGHTFLYNNAVHKMKELIGNSDLSNVYYLYGRRTNLGPVRHDVNAIWDLAPHDISIFNYLLDRKPQWVSATGSKVLRNCREDVGFISLGYSDSTVGHIHVSWADPNKVREVVVVSSERRIVFDDLNSKEPVRVFEKGIEPARGEASNFGEYHFEMRDGDIISPKIAVSEPLKNQCTHFIKCITEGQRPLTGGEAGLEVVQIMEAIDRSIAQRGAPVAIAN